MNTGYEELFSNNREMLEDIRTGLRIGKFVRRNSWFTSADFPGIRYFVVCKEDQSRGFFLSISEVDFSVKESQF